SDVLSCLESGQALELHQDPAAEEGEGEAATPVPQRLGIPENLFFIGTVNVDETTYMFSPKVLDRAFTIELNQVNLRDWGNGVAGVEPAERSPLRVNRFAGTLGRWRRPGAEDWQAFGDLMGGELQRVVLALEDLLAAEQRPFGYRVAGEIARFVALAA